MFYRETYSLLLPTSETWELFRLELDLVGEQFRTAVAPVAFLAGWDVLAALGVAAAVLLADTFAFRAFARAEALVPGGVLFVFVAALGTDRIRIASTMALVGAGVVATVVLRQHHAPVRTNSIGIARRNVGRVIPVAIGSALFVAVIAGFVGPRLPGAGAEAIYETKGASGGNVTEVVSPLVDIRSRLTNRSTTELFTVQADADSYWRSSALPEFDGAAVGASRARPEPSRRVHRPGRRRCGRDPPAGHDLRTRRGARARCRRSDRSQRSRRPARGPPVQPGQRHAGQDRQQARDRRPVHDRVGLAAVLVGDVGHGHVARPGRPDLLRAPIGLPRLGCRDRPRGHGRGDVDLRGGPTAAGLDAQRVPLQLGDPGGPRQQRDRVVPAQPRRLLRTVRRHLRRDAAFDRHPGPRRRWASPRGPTTAPAPTRCSAATPTRGPRSGSTASAGFRSSRHPGAAPPVQRSTPASAHSRTRGRRAATTRPRRMLPRSPCSLRRRRSSAAARPDRRPPFRRHPRRATSLRTTHPLRRCRRTDDGFAVPWRLLLTLAAIGLVLGAPALIRRIRRSSITAPTAQLAHLWTRATDALRSMGLPDAADLTPSRDRGGDRRGLPRRVTSDAVPGRGRHVRQLLPRRFRAPRRRGGVRHHDARELSHLGAPGRASGHRLAHTDRAGSALLHPADLSPHRAGRSDGAARTARRPGGTDRVRWVSRRCRSARRDDERATMPRSAAGRAVRARATGPRTRA